MSAEQASVRPPKPVSLALSSVVGLSPVLLATVLQFMRPDLVGPMMQHQFGSVAFGLLVLLSLVGAGLLTAINLAHSKALRWTVRVLALLLCWLPATFLALFAPIVFAFMYGAAA